MTIHIKGHVYQVGGAVRDALLERPSSDLDYVVVGSTMQDMLAAGFTQVGQEFPVFLHPLTHDEYALARTERKTGPGHRGFSVAFGPEVTLEDDLERRDLTINAMALGQDGELVDPYGGADDLRNGVLRHVSTAFSDDPLRVLRVARFSARFGFEVHPSTMTLMRSLHDGGETHHLTPERVWKETAKALMEEHGSAYWDVLQKVGLGRYLFPKLPGWAATRGIPFRANASGYSDANAMDQSLEASDLSSRAARWSLPRDPFMVAIDDGMTQMWRKVGAPGEVLDRITMTQEFWRLIGLATDEQRTTPSTFWLGQALHNDVLRRPQRWFDAVDDVRNHGVFTGRPTDWLPSRSTLHTWVQALKIDAGAIAKAGPANTVQARVLAAREAAWATLAHGEATLPVDRAPSRDPNALVEEQLPFAPRRFKR